MCAGSPKDEHVRAEPVLQMAPPHTCLINSSKRTGRAHTTCVSFGNRGDKVLIHPRHPMIPLYCLLLLTCGPSPGGVRGEKPVAAEGRPQPCCFLLPACSLLLAACCTVHARVAPNGYKACDNDSCNQNWQQLLCKAMASLPVTALLSTPHISAWCCAGYMSSC